MLVYKIKLLGLGKMAEFHCLDFQDKSRELGDEMGGGYSFASGASIGSTMFLLVMVIFLKGIFADLFLLEAYIPSICICVFLLLTNIPIKPYVPY